MTASGGRKAINNSEDFVRYVSGGKLDKGVIAAGAMTIGPDHYGEMSVDRPIVWSDSINEALVQIRRVAAANDFKLKATGRYIQLNAGQFIGIVAQDSILQTVEIFEDPIAQSETEAENPAHAVVTNMPTDTLGADYLVDLVRPIVKAYHLAKL